VSGTSKFATTVRSCLVRVTSNSKKPASPIVSSNKIIASPKIFAAMVCRNGIGVSQESLSARSGASQSMAVGKRNSASKKGCCSSRPSEPTSPQPGVTRRVKIRSRKKLGELEALLIVQNGSAAGLLTSSCALTFCRPAASASICFYWRAVIAPSSCTVWCSLRNSLSNIAFTAS
jgi:hypothetical protein